MTEPPRAVPDAEVAVRLLKSHFFSRTDTIALKRGRTPSPHEVEDEDQLDALLRAHVMGRQAPPVTIRWTGRGGKVGALRGRFRVGSYTPALDGTTRWLCIDLDGKGHADALADPDGAARRVVATFAEQGLACHLERSGGGHGWHVWVLFDEPTQAAEVRRLAFALLPDDEPLADGGVADPRRGRGIEVFPKQDKHRGGKRLGNLVWLPWWAGAPDTCNAFHRIEGDQLVPMVPSELQAVAPDRLAALVPPEPELPKSSKSSAGKRNEDWSRWRAEALARLPLESIYGRWLTGNRAGEGWLECRDPGSASGDRTPSAGVADGTGQAERGAFHSFISGRTLSVFDFLMEHEGAADMAEATRRIAEHAGLEPPTGGPGKRRLKGLPEIQANNRQLRCIVADAWAALLAANRSSVIDGPRPVLFRRAGQLVRLRRDAGAPHIEALNEPEALRVPGASRRMRSANPTLPA